MEITTYEITVICGDVSIEMKDSMKFASICNLKGLQCKHDVGSDIFKQLDKILKK